jgi:hypothetical protein
MYSPGSMLLLFTLPSSKAGCWLANHCVQQPLSLLANACGANPTTKNRHVFGCAVSQLNSVFERTCYLPTILLCSGFLLSLQGLFAFTAVAPRPSILVLWTSDPVQPSKNHPILLLIYLSKFNLSACMRLYRQPTLAVCLSAACPGNPHLLFPAQYWLSTRHPSPLDATYYRPFASNLLRFLCVRHNSIFCSRCSLLFTH